MGKGRRSDPASSAAPGAPQHPGERLCSVDQRGTGLAGQSLPAQARALLEAFGRARRSVTSQKPPGWLDKDATVVIRAVNTGRVSLRQLLADLPHKFCDLAVASLACSSSSPDWPCPPELTYLKRDNQKGFWEFLADRASWLVALLFIDTGATSGQPHLNSAARREVVHWLVQRNYHKVLAALLVTPAAAAGAEFASACVLLLYSLCYSGKAPSGAATADSERVWRALRTDGFTVGAVLCWLAHVHGRLPIKELAFVACWLRDALAATETMPGATPTSLALMPWDVVALPGSKEDWLQFDADGRRLRVSVGLAQRAYGAFLVTMLSLDTQVPAVMAARRELAEQVTRAQAGSSGGQAAAGTVIATVPSESTGPALVVAAQQLRDFVAAATSCAACGALRKDVLLKACAGCRAVRYCSAGCQKAHWRVHRQACQAVLRCD